MNPFFSKKIKCPICGQINEVVVLISESYGEYYPSTREKDQYVPKWRWRHTEWEHINPYFYSLITCPACYYTNFPDIFSKLPKTLSHRELEYVKHKLAEVSDLETKIINDAGKMLCTADSNRDYTCAILSYILAIYFHNFLNERETSSGGYSLLARLYLRLSWLYREHNCNTGLTKTPDKESELEKTVLKMIRALNDYSVLGKKIAELSKTSFSPNIFHINTLVECLEKDVCQLSIKTQEILKYLDNGSCQDKNQTAENIITKCINTWDFIPPDENTAIKMAAFYFEKSWINDNSLTEKATWKILEMVAYLYDKTGDFSKRDACLRQIINSCHKYRMRLMGKLQTNISLSARAEVELDLKSLNSYIQEITFQYKEENQKDASAQNR